MVDSQQTVLDASQIKTDDEVDLIETAIERGAAAPTVRDEEDTVFRQSSGSSG